MKKNNEEMLFSEEFLGDVKEATEPTEAKPTTSETVEDVTVKNSEPLKKVKAGAATTFNKAITGIKNTLRGFFIVAFVVACITAFLFYKNNVGGMVTITLPTIHLSYLRIALAAIIVTLIGIIGTSNKK